MNARAFAVLAAIGILAGCAANDTRPPNVENACAIFDDRPHWQDAVFATERQWGAPAAVQMAIIWKESSFTPDAATRRTYFLGMIPTGRISSAYGFSQAIDGTWDWYRKDTGRWSADRENFDDAADFVGWYMNKTRVANGIPLHDAYNQYLAYHEGHRGFARGDWRNKAWLVRVASEVQRKALEYDRHIRACT